MWHGYEFEIEKMYMKLPTFNLKLPLVSAAFVAANVDEGSVGEVFFYDVDKDEEKESDPNDRYWTQGRGERSWIRNVAHKLQISEDSVERLALQGSILSQLTADELRDLSTASSSADDYSHQQYINHHLREPKYDEGSTFSSWSHVEESITRPTINSSIQIHQQDSLDDTSNFDGAGGVLSSHALKYLSSSAIGPHSNIPSIPYSTPSCLSDPSSQNLIMDPYATDGIIRQDIIPVNSAAYCPHSSYQQTGSQLLAVTKSGSDVITESSSSGIHHILPNGSSSRRQQSSHTNTHYPHNPTQLIPSIPHQSLSFPSDSEDSEVPSSNYVVPDPPGTSLTPRGLQEQRLPIIASSENSGSVRSLPHHYSPGTIQLWQFIRVLLAMPEEYKSCLRWIDQQEGTFKIFDPYRLAKLWGERKNRQQMNYDKLSRSLRQYYKKKILKKTGYRKRLIYQFVPPFHL